MPQHVPQTLTGWDNLVQGCTDHQGWTWSPTGSRSGYCLKKSEIKLTAPEPFDTVTWTPGKTEGFGIWYQASTQLVFRRLKKNTECLFEGEKKHPVPCPSHLFVGHPAKRKPAPNNLAEEGTVGGVLDDLESTAMAVDCKRFPLWGHKIYSGNISHEICRG